MRKKKENQGKMCNKISYKYRQFRQTVVEKLEIENTFFFYKLGYLNEGFSLKENGKQIFISNCFS